MRLWHKITAHSRTAPVHLCAERNETTNKNLSGKHLLAIADRFFFGLAWQEGRAKRREKVVPNIEQLRQICGDMEHNG